MAKKKKKSKNMMERYHGPLIENEVVYKACAMAYSGDFRYDILGDDNRKLD